MAVQSFSPPLDSLFSSFTAPAPTAVAEQPSSRRLSGVGRTVIAIAAASVFFGGAGSLYMHAAMGHMSPGSMTMNSAAMPQQPGVSAPGGAAMAAPAPAMPVTTGSDAAPPRAQGEGMPMPATAPMPAAPMATAPAPAAATVTAPVKQSIPTTSAGSSSSSMSASASSTVRRYPIGQGDSFSTFAARYGVSEARIAALNPGVDSTSLTVGQTLRVQ